MDIALREEVATSAHTEGVLVGGREKGEDAGGTYRMALEKWRLARCGCGRRGRRRPWTSTGSRALCPCCR